MTNLEITGIIKIICGLAVTVIAIYKGIRITKSENLDTIGLFGIWFFGLLAFLFGLLGQTLQMIDIFDAIAQAGDVSPTIVADVLSNSLSHTISGLLILITSVILWGIIKTIKNSQIKKNTIDAE